MSRFTPTLVLFVVLAAGSAYSEEFRQWTDDTGDFSVKAEFVKVEGGKVFFRKENGVVIQVPANRLSKEDLVYILAEPERVKQEAERVKQEAGGIQEQSLEKQSRANRKALEDGIIEVWKKAYSMEMPAQQVTILKEGFKELVKTLSGKKVIIRFPIESVTESRSGRYHLELGNPGFDNKLPATFMRYYEMELPREQLMSITKSSVLVVTGEMKVWQIDGHELSLDLRQKSAGLAIMFPRSSSHGVGMHLVKPKIRIETPRTRNK